MKKLLLVVSLFLLLPSLTLAATELSTFVEFTGEAENDGAGSALSNAGDVNGDGYDDFLIGAPSSDSGFGLNSGAAYLIYGSATLLTSSELSDTDIVKFSAEAAGDMAGGALSSAGDVNGDGYDDILISASSAVSNTGVVYLIYGQAEKHTSLSLSDASVVDFSGESAGDVAGGTLSGAGDVNGDGYDDFLISSYGSSEGGDYAGAVYLIYGQAAAISSMNLNDSSVIQFTGGAENDSLASGLSSGDINGDGYSDLVLSTSSYDDSTGAFYIIYGQAETLSSITVSDSSVIKFTGENEADNAGGSVSSGADINGDGYDDILVGAIQNSTSGAVVGSAYVIYGQADALVSDTLGGSGIVKFTGEEAGDLAGIDLSLLEDVNGDGYGDILIGASMNDVVATDAGVAYLIFGQAEVLTSMDLSNEDSVFKFLGENDSDIAGDVVSTAGDINGDGLSDVLVSAYVHDTDYEDAGTTYLGYLYTDDDGDGVAGDGGIFAGPDCDDNDAEINPDEVEVQDDVDNNCDGEIDEVNKGTHPDNENLDPTDNDLYDVTISSVVGGKNGNFKVTYSDDSIFRYNVYNITSSKLTKIKHYRNTGYYTILDPKGRRNALINIYNGETLDKIVINKKVSYKYNSLKTFKLRNKYWSVVTSKKKNGKARIAVIRIKINKEEFGKKVTTKTTSKKIKVSKTKRNNNKVVLKNKNNKTIKRYLFTKKYNLKRS